MRVVWVVEIRCAAKCKLTAFLLFASGRLVLPTNLGLLGLGLAIYNILKPTEASAGLRSSRNTKLATVLDQVVYPSNTDTYPPRLFSFKRNSKSSSIMNDRHDGLVRWASSWRSH